jgi:16S rRNA (adenine1518-N6/adenine1519-N6)-dimethyltransferase
MNPKPHKARKRFGQNFLHDEGVIQQIIRAIHPQPEDRLVEIGPGLAAITTPILLLSQVSHLDAVEIDRDLADRLINRFNRTGKFSLHQGDALKFDFATLLPSAKEEAVLTDGKVVKSNKLRIFGNLPYNISTPLIFHLLKYYPLIQDMHFMLQKEVVDRLTAAPDSKNYGRLTIMTQYYCQSTALFNIEPHSFTPAPKVSSTFVRLIPHKTLPYPVQDMSILQTITTAAFNQRRKTISNSLKPYLSANDFEKLNITPSDRPEVLSLKDFVSIANYLSQSNKLIPPIGR